MAGARRRDTDPRMRFPGGPYYPDPNPGTLARIIGPRRVNGMDVWSVHPVLEDGTVGPKMGPWCMSLREAEQRARDFVEGRRKLWFGWHKFKQKKIL